MVWWEQSVCKCPEADVLVSKGWQWSVDSDTFREEVLKREGTAGCVISLHTILRLVYIKVKFQASSTFWFQLG